MPNGRPASPLDRSERKNRLRLLLIGTTVVVGCVDIGTQERRVIVLNEGTLAHRLQVAQEYVTNDRLSLLRASVRKQFPNVKERDVAGLELSWQRMVTVGEDAVVVVVTFTPQGEDADAKLVADYCASEVRAELRPRL